MGEHINPSGLEFCPMLSHDGKYLFFTSGIRSNLSLPETVQSYDDFYKAHINPANNSTDIYWVDAKIIDELRPLN